jgi:drug/metabolite transporter (DMT)-like permease
VRDCLKALELPTIWVLFFPTSVYGHIALKAAVDRAASSSYGAAPRATVGNAWGWSALLAWGLSCLLWALALSRQELVSANSISCLRYVLICLAAWLLLSENVTWPQGLGMLLIGGGILLMR